MAVDVPQEVEVVEEDDEVLVHLGDGCEQPGQHLGDHLAAVSCHERADVVVGAAPGALERDRDMGPEPHRVVVPRVE